LLWKAGYHATGMQSAKVQMKIDLGRVRDNVASIAHRCGVDVIAVVKSDAYGLGAVPVVQTISDLVAGFCVFKLREAVEAIKWQVPRRPTISLGPSFDIDPMDLAGAGVRPSVWTVEEAQRLRSARPVLCVDTGMQRFACPPANVDAVIAAGGIDEAFTHATKLEHVELLKSAVAGQRLRLHAAGSSLLDEPAAHLDAVRPGMAMYRGAARVSCRLVEVHDGGRPAGYTEFNADRFGIILCGYSQGLRRGPCMVNGRRQKILEVGMQSAFVEIAPGDRTGDEVVLLGDGLSETEVAAAWQCSEQQVLVTLANAGIRAYTNA
jgi:alanine racemase